MAKSPSGGLRGLKRVEVFGLPSSRSIRKSRQSLRPLSHATRYQRYPVCTNRCGSTGSHARRTGAVVIREADSFVVAAGLGNHGKKASASNRGAARFRGARQSRAVPQLARARGGRTCSSLRRARTDASSNPVTPRSCGAQSQGDRYGFFVVEQEGRQGWLPRPTGILRRSRC